MKTIYLILLNVLSIIIVNAQPKNLITPEIRQLVDEINVARSNPTLYGINNNLQSERLDTLLSKEPLLIDYKLCQKAHSYCELLNPNYTIQHSTMGYNESIALNDSLYKVCKQLIYDKGHSFKGHRYHLLGITNKDTKIGVGIKYVKELNWFIVVIITD